MSRAWPVNENGRPVMRAACQVIVVVPCAKCACRWRTSGASSTRSASAIAWRRSLMEILGGAVAGGAGDRGCARREVGAAPAVQRLGQRRGVGEVLGPGLDGVDHGVAEPL